MLHQSECIGLNPSFNDFAIFDTSEDHISDLEFVSSRFSTHELALVGPSKCDRGELSAILAGEVGAGTMTLEGEALWPEGEELSVELSLANHAVSGAVTVRGEESQPFTTTEASGDAGVYTAEDTLNDKDYWAGWIVLSDGSQRGKMDTDVQDVVFMR